MQYLAIRFKALNRAIDNVAICKNSLNCSRGCGIKIFLQRLKPIGTPFLNKPATTSQNKVISIEETKKQKQLPRMETEARNDGRVCFGQLLNGVPVLFGNSVNGEVRDAGFLRGFDEMGCLA